jgi:hypothetical protein
VKVFLAAAATEALYLLWVRARRPWLLAVVSAAIASGQVVGLGGAINGHPWQYVCGFAAGSFLAGLAARRWSR